MRHNVVDGRHKAGQDTGRAGLDTGRAGQDTSRGGVTRPHRQNPSPPISLAQRSNRPDIRAALP